MTVNSEKFEEPFTENYKGVTRLTFDEFLPYNDFIDVQRYCGTTRIPTKTTISRASKSMQTSYKERKTVSCFTFSLASNTELDEAFTIPQTIENVDLFSNYWPIRQSSNYLKLRSKLFHGFQKDYCSRAYSTYGGMSEWLSLISGTIEFTLIKPTQYNIIKFSSLEPHEPFFPEKDTERIFKLEKDKILLIPGGWISIRKATRDSFAIGGEFSTIRSLKFQLECFNVDIINSNGQYAITKDTEIRALYWFTAIRLLTEAKPSVLSRTDPEILIPLKIALNNWKNEQKHQKTSKTLYAPSGLQLGMIVDDLRKYLASRDYTQRRRLHNMKYSSDILSDQTSTYNQTY